MICSDHSSSDLGLAMADGESRQVGAEAGARRHAAFISYSNADEEIANCCTGGWSLIGCPRRWRGASASASCSPDRVEFAATHDLGGEIRRSLEASDALSVLCSPRAGSRSRDEGCGWAAD